MSYNFSKELEKQVREEIRPILNRVVAYYDASYRVTEDMNPLLSMEEAEDLLTKLALEMY